ncbi:uncharacterized protein N7443_010709 [Penicillium atrosanguineum]|uniref:DUF6594 domain-containing protein n=1 Tax=Penicillium atrosanguineum TaxID=1132637 RepID=A0A9W9PSM7_9EURO|nr:uncharacterized protein N7443_010709 [Penicillium atrosanguineum]KAJ5141321.1 hypothetical protein N7526_002316 [Penicillium atrosanguineum]KAJ5290456.1 hypothetical protein N7443_010709 [Penicillium atrosanguineum]KAJ5308278.1 hypothetical protein N7476_008934 [Penicillium atrosanguineum]
MPLHNGSHSLRRKSKKDGRNRTSSTVSTISTQAGPVEVLKYIERTDSPGQDNASKEPLDPQAASASSPNNPAETDKKSPNVFEFLDNSSSDSSSSSSSESDDLEPTPPIQAQPVTNIQSPQPRTAPSHSLLSETKTPPTTIKPSSTRKSRSSNDSRPPPAPAPPPAESQMQIARKQSHPRKSSAGVYKSTGPSPPPSKHQLQISRPEDYYDSRDTSVVHRSPLPPSPPSSPEDSLHRGTPTRRRDSSASQVSSGYGLVASHLTHSTTQEKAGFPPLYRRFESVNHRVLLHLQDEIAQMEEELHTLDEYEEMHRIATAEQEGIKPVPASRRMEAQSQAYSSLHYRRMDLMAALTHKIEQYNNALSSYSKVLQTLPRASEDDVQNYRSWMKQHNPIAAAETRFLDQDADLVSLTPRLAASAAAAPANMAIVIASGAILFPLLAFSMIAEFSGRLVVVTVVGGAAAAIAANYSAGIDTLVDSRDGWRCATIYFGFMTLAAMFIP